MLVDGELPLHRLTEFGLADGLLVALGPAQEDVERRDLGDQVALDLALPGLSTFGPREPEPLLARHAVVEELPGAESPQRSQLQRERP